MIQAFGAIIGLWSIWLILCDKRNPFVPWMVLAALALLFIGHLVSPASAQSGHPPEHEEIHQKFYSTWMMPDNRRISCCHGEDCKPAQSRIRNGKWQARHADADEWSDIPASKIETERDSPDGQSHLCGRKAFHGLTVFCFLPAAGG